MFRYLAQAVQMSFFFALIIQISSSVRQKIWFKESGNFSVILVLFLKYSTITFAIFLAYENNGNARIFGSSVVDNNDFC